MRSVCACVCYLSVSYFVLTLSYIGPPFAELIHWASEVAAKQRKYFMMSRPKIKPVGGHYSRMFISYVIQTSVLIGDHKLEIGYGG